MQDMLSTFQKHIGAHFDAPSEAYTKNAIHKFGEDIKGANEFIGALQSASVALRKILKIAKDTTIQDVCNIKASVQEVINNASFMGIELFDTRLDTTLNGITYTFVVENPLPLCKDTGNADSVEFQEIDMNPVISYVEEKLQEISQMLLALSETLTEPNPPAFNPAQFAQMLKGK
ncbi:flagellar FLiS export co-chaperone [Helicobacter japonicus]|uniref:flagellar FLiS export co-chaperone n=1 Tax=Helicobacter japonicus TaxID=425400 RepID=UPI0023BFBA89|nr:flagellar FLiS export co-chaperone [Helicobacter japonicus]MDE7235648.1 flagellar FLiS export co-chaperone [Helicobacter japonicus]